MPNLTIRNLPEETHRAIKSRARLHGRSTEAEIREILKAAAIPEGTSRMGDELAALGAAFGGIEIDVRRSKRPMRAAKFETR
jgi:antitoxin FitA